MKKNRVISIVMCLLALTTLLSVFAGCDATSENNTTVESATYMNDQVDVVTAESEENSTEAVFPWWGWLILAVLVVGVVFIDDGEAYSSVGYYRGPFDMILFRGNVEGGRYGVSNIFRH